MQCFLCTVIHCFIKGHTFDHEGFHITVSLISFYNNSYFSTALRSFSSSVGLMDLSWPLSAHVLAIHMLLLSLMDDSTVINSPAKITYTWENHLHSVDIQYVAQQRGRVLLKSQEYNDASWVKYHLFFQPSQLLRSVMMCYFCLSKVAEV